MGDDFMIHIENLYKVYRNGSISVEALKGINLHVDEGEFVAIMGAFRVGKVNTDEYYRLS